METMKDKFFLRGRRQSQAHSKGKNDAVRRTGDLSDIGDESSSTPFPSPDTIHRFDALSLANEPETQAAVGSPLRSSSPRTAVEGPRPALLRGASASAELQSTAAKFAFRPKSGKAKKLWRKVRDKVSVTAGLRNSKQPTSPLVDVTSITQPQTTNTDATCAPSQASGVQIDDDLIPAPELVVFSSTTLTYPNLSAISQVAYTAVSPASCIRARASVLQDNAAAVITILRDLGEIAENIPCIKAVAGATLVLLKIREEMEDVHESITELIDDVWRRSLQLIESLNEVTCPDGGHCISGQIEQSLLNYQILLESMTSDLIALKSQGSIRKALERASTRKKIEGYRRRLHSFDSTFSAGALVAILKQVEKVVERTEHLVSDERPLELPQDDAYGGAGHSLAGTMAFVINELAHKSLIATDRLVMRQFVEGDASQPLLTRGKKGLPFFF